MAAARNIEVNGTMHNDVWAAGASISVNAPVDDNATLAGGDVNLNRSAAVCGDARITAGTASIEAPIIGM